MKKFLYFAIMAIQVFILLSCDPENEDSKDPNTSSDNSDVVAVPGTVVLDEKLLDEVVELNDRYMIVKGLSLGVPLEAATKADAHVTVAEGNYFICSPNDMAPDGMLKRMTSIEPYGNGYFKVQFDPNNYGLGDIFKYVNIAPICLAPSDIESVTDDEGNKVEWNMHKIKFNYRSYPFKNGNEKDKTIYADFTINCDLDYEFTMHPRMENGDLAFSFGVKTSPDISVSTDLTLKSPNILELLTKKLNITFKPVTVMVGMVPVVVRPKLNITLKLELTGSIKAKGTIWKWKPTFEAGVDVTSNDKDVTLKPYYDKDLPPLFDNLFTDVNLGLEGELKFTVDNDITALLYGAAGPTVTVSPYGKITAETGISFDPEKTELKGETLTIKPAAGLDGKVGVETNLFNWKEVKREATFNLLEVTFDEWVKGGRPVVKTRPFVGLGTEFLMRGLLVKSSEDITSWGFEYNEVDSPTIMTVNVPLSASEQYYDNENGLCLAFQAVLPDAKPGKQYEFRAFAENEKGTGYGESVTGEMPEESRDIVSGLVAYYPFSGNANDATGNGHNGTVSGSVNLTSDRYGNPNSAYWFPGSSWNYISVPDDPQLHMDEYTLSAWIYSDNASACYGFDQGGYIINKGRDIENGSYRLRANSVGATVLYGGKNDAFTKDIPSVGTWHMVTGTVKGNKACIYIDGTLAGETELSTAFKYSNNAPLTIGMHYYSGVPTMFAYSHYGAIDEVYIYNRALTPSEVRALYSK